MGATGTIVEIELVEPTDDGAWRWRALHGQPGAGAARFTVDGIGAGDRLVAEIRAARAGWTVHRLVRVPAHTRPTPPTPADTVAGDLGRDRGPARRRSGDARPGDVLLLRFRFNRSDDTGRASKQRPCLVMEVTGDEYRVRPIHGSNSFVRRVGAGRRIVDWAGAGLHKPSIVAAVDHWVPRSGCSRPVGTLTATDQARLLTPADDPD